MASRSAARSAVGLLLAAAAAAGAGSDRNNRPPVTALEPVALDHVQPPRGSAEGGRPLEIRTLSMDPPVFLLRGLLDGAEADELLALARARAEGWQPSVAGDGDKERHQKWLKAGGKQALKLLRGFDRDDDGRLSSSEVKMLVKDSFGLPNFDDADFAAFAAHVGDNPQFLSFKDVLAAEPVAYFQGLAEREPHRRERFSEQVWLDHDGPLLRAVLNRTAAVTGLPPEVMMSTESMQVVRYPQLGHYACHHDSSPDSIDSGNMRIATVGMVLNDVEQGGETAFPGADLAAAKSWTPDQWATLEDRCQVTTACTSLGGLVVPPRKGDGLLWYNIRPSALAEIAAGGPRRQRGERSFGERTLLWSSMHCGAAVLKGEKWFANLWLHLPRSWTKPPRRGRRKRQKAEL